MVPVTAQENRKTPKQLKENSKMRAKATVGIIGGLAAALVLATTSAGREAASTPPSSEQPATSIAASKADGPVGDERAYELMTLLAGDGKASGPGAYPAAASLVPRSQSRVITENEKGRVTVAATSDDTGFCYVAEPESDGFGAVSGCLRSFDESGLAFGIAGTPDLPEVTVAGVADDTVAVLRIRLASGKTVEIDVLNNGFFATVSTSDLPETITAVRRDGTSHSTTTDALLDPGPTPEQ
jgi:hypothetical protein